MSLLRHIRLKSKSRSPDLKRKSSNVSTVVIRGVNQNESKRKSGEITRSDTFTIKLQTPERDLPPDCADGDDQNYRTFTRSQGSRVKTDVFDALYTRGLIHKKRDSVSFRGDEDHNEYDEYVKSSKFDGGTYRKSKHGTPEPVKFDGGTYRKSSMKSIIRKDTFTKQDSVNKPTYIFGGAPKQNSRQSSESEDDNEKKVAEVMSWYVKLDDLNHPQIETRVTKKEDKSNVILHIPNDNYKPKPLPRTSIVKRQETFRVTSEPIQVEIQRKPSIKEPIRIEIRNPPLSKRDRDNSSVRPIGVAVPYNKKTPVMEIGKRPPFLSGVAAPYRDHYSAYNTPVSKNKQTTVPPQSAPASLNTSKEFSRIHSFWNRKQNDKDKISSSSGGIEATVATTKPKKLHKFWSSLNGRSKKRLDLNVHDDNDSINRYTYTSKTIMDQENEHNQNKTIPRRTNATSNTLSWLMKVKSKKNN